MSEHYFSKTPLSESKPESCAYSYRGHPLTFTSDAGVFSRGEVDFGTDVLLKALPSPMHGRVLDLGCGWGVVGVCVSKANPDCQVVMSDVNGRALGLARQNLKANGVHAEVVESDGLQSVPGKFDIILTNPPIRAGKQVIYRLFSESASRLNPGGALYIVIRKQQGAPSAITYLKTLFAKVDTIEKSGGFWVLRCEGSY